MGLDNSDAGLENIVFLCHLFLRTFAATSYEIPLKKQTYRTLSYVGRIVFLVSW